MPKIIYGLLCAVLLLAPGNARGAVPDKTANEEAESLKTFLKCSNDVMVSSRGLEIHYKQIPASKIQIDSLRTGTASTAIRKYLASFARIVVANPIKTNSTTIQPGSYHLGLLEERPGSGRWFFAVIDITSGKSLLRLDPVFTTLSPEACARVMTLELDRRPGSNRLKFILKWGDLSVTTREMLEL